MEEESQLEKRLIKTFDKMMTRAINGFRSALEEERRSREIQVAERHNELSRRLMSLEESGIPVHEFDQLKRLIGTIDYRMREDSRAVKGLLSFFQMSKRFIDETTKLEDATIKETKTE